MSAPASHYVTVGSDELESRKTPAAIAPTAPTAPTMAQFRPLGDPTGLGNCAFATTTFVLSCYNAKFLSAESQPVVLGLAMFYGGMTQLIAGLWAFARNNAFGGTTSCSFGAFWLSHAWHDQFVVHGGMIAQSEVHNATGMFLLTWTIFTFILWVVSFKTDAATLATFTILEITMVLLTVGNFCESDPLIQAGGWTGVITSFCAWYCGMSALFRATWKQEVLPVRSLVKED